MASQTITSRLPQQGDPVEVLLARLLASTSQRVTGTALASLSRTSTTQSSDIDCTGFKALLVIVSVTAVPGAGGLQLRLRARDPVTGNLPGIFIGTTTISAVSLNSAMFGPGFGGFVNGSAGGLGGAGIHLPDTIRIEVSHATADPYTYSVGYCLVP